MRNSMTSNHQRMARTGARVGCPLCHVGLSRGASLPSGVEPARRRFVKPLSYADCFLSRPLASSTYAEWAWFRHLGRCLPPPNNGPMMTDQNRSVQPMVADAGQISVNCLTPEACAARQVRRGAAGFNHALQRTRPSRPGCNRTPLWAGSLSLGRYGYFFEQLN